MDVMVPSFGELEILENHKGDLDEFLVQVPLQAHDLVYPTQVIDLERDTGAPVLVKPHFQDLQGLAEYEAQQHNNDYRIYSVRDLRIIYPHPFQNSSGETALLNLYVLT